MGIRRQWLMACCVVALLGVASLSLGQGAAAPATTSAPAARSLEDQIKNPVDWLTWGADLRVREVYFKNVVDLLDEVDDTRHFFRIRGRIWTQVGPFFSDDTLDASNGVSAYVRMTYEPRYYVERQNTIDVPQWNEAVFDNLYVDLVRLGGLPLSLRVGRQDLVYGRGWLILDGTPLDGSRTIYSDAIKATIHMDGMNSNLDLFVIDNKGRQKRLEPINERDECTSEYDARLFGAYLMTNYSKAVNWNAYYIYKDEDALSIARTPGRIVHTAGLLFNGILAEDWDYYAEGAFQWGREGSARRNAYGFVSDLGYTFRDAWATPRVHAGYEYLSGDDPDSGVYEGWDAVLSRWPQWSELYVYRWAMEGGMPGQYSNLQRITLGIGGKPTPKMGATLNYNYVLANEHPYGKSYVPPAAPYDNGSTRGQHVEGKLTYTFNKYVAGHLLAEYFHPESYYSDETDDALFLRWELTFKF